MAVRATTRDLPTMSVPQLALRPGASPAAGSVAAIRFTVPSGDAASDTTVSPSSSGPSPARSPSAPVRPVDLDAGRPAREGGTTGSADVPTNLVLVAESATVVTRDGRASAALPAPAPAETLTAQAAAAAALDPTRVADRMSERNIETADAKDGPRADGTDKAGVDDETPEEPVPAGAGSSTVPQPAPALGQFVLPQTSPTGFRSLTSSDGFGRDATSVDAQGRVGPPETVASALPGGSGPAASAAVRRSPPSLEMPVPADRGTRVAASDGGVPEREVSGKPAATDPSLDSVALPDAPAPSSSSAMEFPAVAATGGLGSMSATAGVGTVADPVQGARTGEDAASAAAVPPNGPASGAPAVMPGTASPSGPPAPLPAADSVSPIPANGIVSATDEFVVAGPSLAATGLLVPPSAGGAFPVPPPNEATSPDAAGSDLASASTGPARPNPVAERQSAVPVLEAGATRIGVDRDVSAKEGFDGLLAATGLGPAPPPNGPSTAAPANAAPAAASDANAAPAPAQAAPVPLGAVPMTIGLRSLAGSNRFEIRLDPKELGRIDVNLDIDKETGTVSAHLVVDRPETLALLQRDAGNLQQALSQAGLDAGEASINLSLRSEGHSHGGNGAGQDDRNGRNGAPGGTPGAGKPEPRHSPDAKPLRSLGGLTGIDIRI